MNKAILIVLTVCMCAIANAATTTTNKTAETRYPIHLGGIADFHLKISAVGFLDEKLYVWGVYVDYPKTWRLISVAHGKTDGSYLITMQRQDYFGGEYMRTFILDLRDGDFLQYVASEHGPSFKKDIRKEQVELGNDLMLIWNPISPASRVSDTDFESRIRRIHDPLLREALEDFLRKMGKVEILAGSAASDEALSSLERAAWRANVCLSRAQLRHTKSFFNKLEATTREVFDFALEKLAPAAQQASDGAVITRVYASLKENYP